MDRYDDVIDDDEEEELEEEENRCRCIGDYCVC